MIDSKFEKQYISLLFFLFLSLSLIYAFITPFNGTSDEVAHFDYVNYLIENRQLPDPSKIRDISTSDGSWSRQIEIPLPREEIFYYEFHQPPLYYLLNAPFLYIAKAINPQKSYLLLRIVSIALGLWNFFLIYRISHLVFTKEPYFRVITMTLLLAIPSFIYISSMINNDALTNLLATSMILQCLLIIRNKKISNFFCISSVLIISASLLTKVILYPLALILCLLIFRKIKINRFILLIFTPLALISLLWFGRNYINQGNIFGWKELPALAPYQPGELNIVTLADWFDTLFKSFWAVFGWMDVYMSNDLYITLKLFTLLTTFGLVSFFVNRLTSLSKLFKKSILFLGVSLLVIFFGVLNYSLDYYQPQGRYLFVTISSYVIFMSIGLYEIITPKLKKSFLIFLFFGALMINIMSIIKIFSSL